MKIYYHSAFRHEELIPGRPLRVVPTKAELELKKDKNEDSCEIIYNGTPISSDTQIIECNELADLSIKQAGNRVSYSVKPSVKMLTSKLSRPYDQFYDQYSKSESDLIDSIQLGLVKMYAVDQSTEIVDCTELLSQIEAALPAFKAICDKPKSHLKAANEVRPIETVKRIGYESIPYLAAHSEDWLARTASGLKPARLFSRVEDDDYQIYENRVVKTLINQIIAFLRKTEKQTRDQRDQLKGIMNNSVQTGSFGFDVTFQKAVSELTKVDNTSNDYRSKVLELIEKIQKKSYSLLKKYRSLRKSRLYRYLNRTKPVLNPLNETNILLMDKHYSIIFKLWKTVNKVISAKEIEDEYFIAFDDLCDEYCQFCCSLIGYTAHVLGFTQESEGIFIRESDNITLTTRIQQDNTILVTVEDSEYRSMALPPNIAVPINPGESYNGFRYDGSNIEWSNKTTNVEIDDFCNLFKAKGKELADAKKKSTELKQLLSNENVLYTEAKNCSFIVLPSAVEIDSETRSVFRNEMVRNSIEAMKKYNADYAVVAIPLCDDNEQKLIDYAKSDDSSILILPLSMYDINSFRRLQNLLYRHIIYLGKDSCPNCGGKMRRHNNQFVCDQCNQLTLTETICPNADCQHKYHYLTYDISSDTVERMKKINTDSFYQWDSRFQYKDIVEMTFEEDKIKTICPHCKR